MFNLFSKKKDTKEKVMAENDWHPSDELTDTVIESQESEWHPSDELVNQEAEIESVTEEGIEAETNADVIPEYSLDSLMYDPAVLGWGSVDEQEALFAALMLYYQPGESILDVGCGRADLYDFVKRVYQSEFVYTGIDYNPNIIEVAKAKYEGVNVEALDALSLSGSRKHDWVYASGLFNLRDHEDMLSYLMGVVDAMYNESKLGVAFNLMTMVPDGATEEERNQLTIWAPGLILDMLIQKYNKVLCRTDYMLGDATFLIIK